MNEVNGYISYPVELFFSFNRLDKFQVLQYDKNMTAKKIEKIKQVYIKPKRVFEKSGVVNPEMSYYVSLENVVNKDKQDIQTMVDRGRYFSIFAPRQSGKTTFLEEICDKLHKDPTYIAILLSFQKYKNLGKPQFYSLVEKKLYERLLNRLDEIKCEKIEKIREFLNHHPLTDHISFSQLFEELNRLIQQKKIVIFIDEFDGIPQDQLEDFLTALRDLYQEYKKVKQKALYSIGLVGIRDITKLVVGGISPFNIADQVTLPPFSLENVGSLYAQYTEETNQPFTAGAVQKIHEETAGQPWLVNRLGTILTMDIKHGTTKSIDETDVERAIDMLLREKNDHFDNLYEKSELYRETFIEIVFDHVKYRSSHKEQSWLEQYGLIKDDGGMAVVANNIYKARFTVTFFEEANVPVPAPGNLPIPEYRLPGDKLHMKQILLDFDRYIARIGVNAFYGKQKPYEKTGQYLLTAWLFQFARSGEGELRNEAPTGLGRMDMLLTFKGKKYIVETKVNRYAKIDDTLEEGTAQLCGKYLATEDAAEGYLVVFDPRTPVGTVCKPKEHRQKDCRVTSFTIGIGRPE